MPGIPLVSWGEEQAFYVLDNTAPNYIFGRQPISSSQAWKLHGCYNVGDENLHDAPFNSSLTGCHDDSVSLDHRDPSHPVYNTLKHMFELRQRYPVLQDGFALIQLSNQTFEYRLPGSYDVPTETGLWSTYRGRVEGVQDFSGQSVLGNQPVWLLYSNYNDSTVYESDCKASEGPTLSPYDAGTTVKNLFYPHDEWTLEESSFTLGVEGSTKPNGCLPRLNMTLYGWKAFVPIDAWLPLSPVITGFSPGHDMRIVSTGNATSASTIDVELRFSQLMDCDSVRDGLSVMSTTDHNRQASIATDSLDCMTIDPRAEAYHYGPSPSIWRAAFTLENVYDGIHRLTVNNVSSASGGTTGSKDHFMLRIGAWDNPMVFPAAANYSSSLLYKLDDSTSYDINEKRSELDGDLSPSITKSDNLTTGSHKHANKRAELTSSSGLLIHHKAAGADKWRYSLSFGAIWSEWYDYEPGNATLPRQTWTGSAKQQWNGEHVQVQYWSQIAGSSAFMTQGDLVGVNMTVRRFPHIFIHGAFNAFGYDTGIPNTMSQMQNGTWWFDFLAEWPTNYQLNVWGMADDGRPDLSVAMGDVDHDGVMDRISPVSLQQAVVNITDQGPPSPALSWRIMFDDLTFRYHRVPSGNRIIQIIIYALLWAIPVLTAIVSVRLYMTSFYSVKFNRTGLPVKRNLLPIAALGRLVGHKSARYSPAETEAPTLVGTPAPESPDNTVVFDPFAAGIGIMDRKRRTVLIATMEYDIVDWGVKIKIGGLGVMAQLMGKSLQHQNLIWVVPCVGGIDYPIDNPADPIDVVINGKSYDVQVQYHVLDNITYVLLDAPVFRRQTAKEPYPPRMDDVESAIYYSAWNQCIAQTMNRFDIDLYHINDYHGTIAPLYLLPRTIPVCLSLHNAEFQGLWPMRNPKEVEEVCAVYNLSKLVVQRYIQFGEVFNLLHAGASLLRIHQGGFGAVGVSKKYGKRSWARYPIFWGLNRIGSLPNPDPSDIAEWDKKKKVSMNEITIDQELESQRAALKRQAQEWAGLEQREDADLFVFVGRWSMQKGIDLIADVFPAILDKYKHTQLIAVGPTIDLYGKFAALKLEKMMQMYPGRVYSKPEFTALPPYIFSGAEFALIPSRDEPFGLVAVEFGRKGALGVGSRVGGLGQMPGWWYTLESSTTKHQMHQFKLAIALALKSNQNTRALMRARAAKQRFPVAQWKEDLEILQATCIKIHRKRADHVSNKQMGLEDRRRFRNSGISSPGWMSPRLGGSTPAPSRPTTRPPSPERFGAGSARSSYYPELRSALSSPGFSVSSSRASSRRNSADHRPDSRGEYFGALGQRYSAIRDSPDIVASPSGLREHGDMRDAAELHKNGDIELGRATSPTEHERALQLQTSLENLGTDSPARAVSPSILRSDTFGAMGMTNQPTSGNTTPNRELLQGSSRPHTPMAEPYSRVVTPALSERGRQDAKPKRQNLTPLFTDPTGLYYKTFQRRLEQLNGKNSETTLCIEEYLEKSEKQWFQRLHDVKMSRDPTPAVSRAATPAASIYEGIDTKETVDQFLLPEDHTPPTGLRRFMMYKLGDWPTYSLLIALGQILAANSYQISLISGQVGQTATQLYIIACVYLATTFIWWFLFRRISLKYCLSLPFFFYGFAFLLIALAPYGTTTAMRGNIQMAASSMYAVASSSGSIFFAQNFGSLGSVAVKDWAFRACAIQGTQQLYGKYQGQGIHPSQEREQN
jgi:alpha-1,3-glucan synthase